MSLGQHLVELRKRLMLGALGILAGGVAGWFLYGPVWDAMRQPIAQLARARHDNVERIALNYTSITGGFDVQLQVALTIGIVVSSPVWLYQIFAFLVPGLTRREKRFTFGFFFSAVPLFLAGCAAGWWVLPHIVDVMYTFVPAGSTTFFETKYYLDFVLKLVLATGIAFVLPVFLVLLNFIGILSGRTILRGWRWAVLAIAIFTAIATPAADLISMFLLAIPMIVLYFLAVGIALLHDRRAAKKTAAFEAEAGLTV
ncbi:MAG TPA: twin-arginine translocase subunit TatC [Pseudolysinimonas sp.]|nr:twin-arginine translocase subunit TatC [Pseudolysinimonas sp.]